MCVLFAWWQLTWPHAGSKSCCWWAHGQSYTGGDCPAPPWWDTWTLICVIPVLSSLLWPLWVPVHPALQQQPLPFSSSGPSSCVFEVWSGPASACARGRTWCQRHRGRCSSSSWAVNSHREKNWRTCQAEKFTFYHFNPLAISEKVLYYTNNTSTLNIC